MEAAVSALKKAFPEAMLVTKPIERGLTRPCIQLLLEAVSLKREMGRRWRRGEELTLIWYPPDETEPDEAAEKLALLLKKAFPQARTEAAVDRDTLRLQVKWEQLCFLSEQEAEKMKRQILLLRAEMG